MANRRWMLPILALSVLLASVLACTQAQPPKPTVTSHPLPSVVPTVTRSPPTPTAVLAAATRSPVPPTPTATVPLLGPGLTDVQFALDVLENGQLVFPATEFVFGVTRIYARFSYRGLGDVKEVQTIWYRNDNPVSRGTLAWDGGQAGDYLIWLEDPDGLGRGDWRWELVAGGQILGGGTFTILGEPRYINEVWGLSFDPPVNWESESETADFVTFSSPNQRQALALRVAPQSAGLSETAANNLAVFQTEHPEAEVVTTEEVTMSGKEALLQQVHYTDEESGEETLFIVSALHAESVYSLWMLGPAEEAETLKRLLFATVHSLRFLTDE